MNYGQAIKNSNKHREQGFVAIADLTKLEPMFASAQVEHVGVCGDTCLDDFYHSAHFS